MAVDASSFAGFRGGDEGSSWPLMDPDTQQCRTFPQGVSRHAAGGKDGFFLVAAVGTWGGSRLTACFRAMCVVWRSADAVPFLLPGPKERSDGRPGRSEKAAALYIPSLGIASPTRLGRKRRPRSRVAATLLRTRMRGREGGYPT